MKEKTESISLVIPAHNSGRVIAKSLAKYSKFLSRISKNYEIIVSCNVCTDKTEEIAKALAKRNRHIKVIRINERGKGFAVIEGLKRAHFKIIGFMDADGVFDLRGVETMLKKLGPYDCVVASKWLNQNIFDIPEPLPRKILAVGWKALILTFFQMRFHDTQAGCKFMTRESFKKIDKNFICNGFDFDVELLFKLKKTGCKIGEFYVPVSRTFEFSTFRIKFIPGMFWRLFKLWTKNIG